MGLLLGLNYLGISRLLGGWSKRWPAGWLVQWVYSKNLSNRTVCCLVGDSMFGMGAEDAAER